MKVWEVAREEGLLIQAIKQVRASEEARTGVHVSTIVNDILRLQDPKKYAQEFNDITRLAFQETGNAIEDILASALRSRIPGWTKPEPRNYRGIIGSPDGWSPRASCIDEIKACWSKMSDFVTYNEDGEVTSESLKFIGYKMQILFYMLAWGANRARLHVLFITGDHHPPFPEPRTYRLVPNRRDLTNNYHLIRQHGEDMGLIT